MGLYVVNFNRSTCDSRISSLWTVYLCACYDFILIYFILRGSISYYFSVCDRPASFVLHAVFKVAFSNRELGCFLYIDDRFVKSLNLDLNTGSVSLFFGYLSFRSVLLKLVQCIYLFELCFLFLLGCTPYYLVYTSTCSRKMNSAFWFWVWTMQEKRYAALSRLL